MHTPQVASISGPDVGGGGGSCSCMLLLLTCTDAGSAKGCYI